MCCVHRISFSSRCFSLARLRIALFPACLCVAKFIRRLLLFREARRFGVVVTHGTVCADEISRQEMETHEHKETTFQSESTRIVLHTSVLPSTIPNRTYFVLFLKSVHVPPFRHVSLSISSSRAWKCLQERGVAVQQEARLQKEAADESRLKDQIREVTTRVAGGETEAAVNEGQQLCLLASTVRGSGCSWISSEDSCGSGVPASHGAVQTKGCRRRS